MSEIGISCALYREDGEDLTEDDRERIQSFVREFESEHHLANEVGEPFHFDVEDIEKESVPGTTQEGVSIVLTQYWVPELEQMGGDPGQVIRYDRREAKPFLDDLREEFGGEMSIEVNTGVW